MENAVASTSNKKFPFPFNALQFFSTAGTRAGTLLAKYFGPDVPLAREPGFTSPAGAPPPNLDRFVAVAHAAMDRRRQMGALDA
ncbi:hypothetical protein [Burkholderia ubonensis]|uniref:hypothetical protein n=1 Tax=Burkholderia ubonensis TaxID=101571 RepID=UPI0012F9624F|nr:hypothetical protein [Burkholderia ubonensis]